MQQILWNVVYAESMHNDNREPEVDKTLLGHFQDTLLMHRFLNGLENRKFVSDYPKADPDPTEAKFGSLAGPGYSHSGCVLSGDSRGRR